MVTGNHEEKVTGIQTMGLLFSGYTFFVIKTLLSLYQEVVQEFQVIITLSTSRYAVNMN